MLIYGEVYQRGQGDYGIRLLYPTKYIPVEYYYTDDNCMFLIEKVSKDLPEMIVVNTDLFKQEIEIRINSIAIAS